MKFYEVLIFVIVMTDCNHIFQLFMKEKRPLESLEQGLTPKLKPLSFGCKCLICGIQFQSQRNLDSHISKVHNKNLYYVQCRFVRKSINFITHPTRYGPPLNLLSNRGQKSQEQKIQGFEENYWSKQLEKSRDLGIPRQNSLVFRPLKLLKTSTVHEEKKSIQRP